MTNDPTATYGDEIDLRAIFQTLWKARKLILIATLAAAIIAFVVSFWILPRQYQATAYVFIGQPVVGVAQTTGFTITPTLPDLAAVVKLAIAPSLLESVLRDPAVAAAIANEEFSTSDMSRMAFAVAVGKDQLGLQVTNTDPQRVALLANTWAEKVAQAVNTTYGLGAVAHTLDAQVLQSQKDYELAQAALENALSQSRVDTLSAQLQREQADLKCVLESASQTMRVLNDLQALEQGLSGISSESPLSTGDGLALITLRQRSLTSQPCQLEGQSQFSSASVQNAPDFSVQIDSAAFSGFTASKALAATAQMRVALQTQLTHLQSEQSRLEQEIPQLQKDLEGEQAQLAQFSLKSDQSKELYAALLQQQQRVITVLGQSAKVASLSVEAVPPDKANSRGTVMNTALAGMVGLMLSVFAALAVNWLRNE